MMRITSNSVAANLVAELDRLSSEQSRLTQEMATGRRLLDPNDDVAATGRVMSYNSQQAALRQYESNSQRALTNLSISTTALNALKDAASSAFNIGPSAMASGDPTAQATYASQLNGQLEQALSLANQQLNGSYLFGAAANTQAPFTATRNAQSQITSIAYNAAGLPGANGAALKVAVDENTTVATTTSGAENQQILTFLNNLVSLRDNVTANNQAGMQTAQNAIDTDENNIVGMLGNLAASQVRVKSIQTQNASRFNQLVDLSSSDTEADQAQVILQYKASVKSYESALQAGSNLMQKSLLDYI